MNAIRKLLYDNHLRIKGDYLENRIITAFEKIIPELKEIFFTAQFKWCQNIESKIIESIVLKMIEEDHLLPWMVHDCVYVKKAYKEKYDNYKEKTFESKISIYLLDK